MLMSNTMIGTQGFLGVIFMRVVKRITEQNQTIMCE